MYLKQISIIVPIYNVEHYLPQCLNSLLNQDLTSYEIICVNDGSPDNSKEIVEAFQSKNENIILINQENKGLSEARNVGINNAQGEFLFFVDSDDFIEPNSIGIIYRIAKANNLDILDFRVNYFKRNIKKVWNKNNLTTNKPICGREYFNLYIKKFRKQPNVSAWCHLFKTEFIKNNLLKFYSGIYFEDLPFTAEAYLLANRVLFTDLIVYNYRTDQSSITRSNANIKQINDLLFVGKKLNEISNKHNVVIPLDNLFSALRKKINTIVLADQKIDTGIFLKPNIYNSVNFILLKRKNFFLHFFLKRTIFLKLYFLFLYVINIYYSRPYESHSK